MSIIPKVIQEEIFQHRGNPSIGYNTQTWIELFGGTPVEITSVEPDPQSAKHTYYYNSRLNVLFKRVFASGPRANQYIWKRVSQ